MYLGAFDVFREFIFAAVRQCLIYNVIFTFFLLHLKIL
jgi:hypothetical protein